MKHAIVWADIPVRDLDRAQRFYAAILGEDIPLKSGPGFRFCLLPHYEEDGQGNVAGCLVEDESHPPSADGPLIYVNVEGRLDAAVAAVGESGGEVLVQTHPVGEHGYRAIVMDSEGNRIALHSESGV